MITKKRVRQMLSYDEHTGVFTHKTNTTHRKVGDRAGHLHKHSGYRHIAIDGNYYKEHRVAFLYMEGYIPEEVDHINRVKDDNRWCNLRAADRHINCTNQGVRKDNATGVKGLSYSPANKFSKWLHGSKSTALNIRNHSHRKKMQSTI